MARKKYQYQLVVTCPRCGVQHTETITTVNRKLSGLIQHLMCVCLMCSDWAVSRAFLNPPSIDGRSSGNG